MTLFSGTSVDDNTQMLLYETIKEELVDKIDAWLREDYKQNYQTRAYYESLPDKNTLVQWAMIGLQFGWDKLGYKFPERERKLIDNSNINI